MGKGLTDYIAALEKNSTAPLHINLELDGTSDNSQCSSWASLGKAIHNTRRFIRCIRLRFKGADSGDSTVLSVLNAFGRELIGSTSVESLVLEGKLGTLELECLKVFLTGASLRGIKFHQTDINHSSFLVLRDFFVQNKDLKTLDLSENHAIDDKAILECIEALLRGKANLETLTVDCLRGNENSNMSVNFTELIAWFVWKTPSIVNLRLCLDNFNNMGVAVIANALKSPRCHLSRVELAGKFDDDGLKLMGRALKTNESVRTISITSSEHLTAIGGEAILRAALSLSASDSWESIAKNNHTLKSDIVAERHASTMGDGMILQLRDITTVDPRRTMQNKAWHFINT